MANDHAPVAQPEQATAAVHVSLSPALVNLFPGAERRLTVPAATVAEMIAALDERWPGMGDRIADSTPAIRRHMNIFVDGERARLDSQLKPDATVYVLTAMSGG